MGVFVGMCVGVCASTDKSNEAMIQYFLNHLVYPGLIDFFGKTTHKKINIFPRFCDTDIKILKIFLFIYVGVCVCVCVCMYIFEISLLHFALRVSDVKNISFKTEYL